jgi:hypothetical protein
MSALPPRAKIVQRDRDVRFVPKADTCLFKQFFLTWRRRLSLFGRRFGIVGIKMINPILPHLHKGP